MGIRYLAYEGTKLNIEWFFNNKGRSRALEYYHSLDPSTKKKFWFLLRALADRGYIKSKEKFRHEGDQIYAFKISQTRYLCFFEKDSKLIITNAFTKKTDKCPKHEKERALASRDDYLYRMKKGTYYES